MKNSISISDMERWWKDNGQFNMALYKRILAVRAVRHLRYND